ncbi:MAG: methyltransferase domain-containing protein [Patescibacteria group bacterium]|nr:methyltransferase domain-containing protein [Patescibacteria group bacterium]
MKDLPKSEVYEQEFEYMPWGILIEKVLAIIQKEATENGRVLDLMCGPGYLLGEIAKRRDDLTLEGIDICGEFINFAQNKYPNISFQEADVLSWKPTNKYDVILCTGGIHHLPYDKQELFLEKLPATLNPNGFVVFADPYVDDYSNESERKQAAAKLGYEYMLATIKNGAPDDVTKATIDILYNDVMGFEYKTSLKKLEPVFRKLFPQLEIEKTWPESDSEFGDYYIIGKGEKKLS